MTASARQPQRCQPDTVPPDVWRRLMRHLGTADLDWEFLLLTLEQQKSGTLEFNIKDGQAQAGYVRIALRYTDSGRGA